MFHPETQRAMVKSHHQDIFKESEGSRLRNIGKTRHRSRPSLLQRIFIHFGRFSVSSGEEIEQTRTIQRVDKLIRTHEG